MNWYQNSADELKELIQIIAKEENRTNLMIEKDFLQSVLIKQLSEVENSLLVFKGGTSLSKTYQIINRFSEDIDLSSNKKLTESERRKINNAIYNIATDSGLTLTNPENIHSRYSFNKYEFTYNSLFRDYPMPIIIETSFYQCVYPVHKRAVHSFVEDFYNKQNINIPIPLDISNVSIKTQSLERTFVDKVFAICDYKLKNTQERHSRHLYDIAKILPHIEINNTLKELIGSVREDRMQSKNNPSAQPQYDIPQMLKEIITSHSYESDYNNITKKLLYEEYSYEQAITNGIQIISEMDLFKYDKDFSLNHNIDYPLKD